MKHKHIAIVVLIAAVVAVANQNHETVTVWFLFWQVTGSRAAVLLLTFAGGCFTGGLMGFQRKSTAGPWIIA